MSEGIGRTEQDARPSKDRSVPVGIWIMGAVAVVGHLATTHFGFHRDELYFIAASERLTPSYVDFQPIVPLLVRGTRALFGDALLGLRAIPSLASGAAVVLAALIARGLGGGRRAQLLAGFAMLVVPLYVGMYTILNTVALETVAWMLVALALIRLLRTDDPRWWLAVGAAIGGALLVKFTVLAYLLGLGIAILFTPLRRHLRTPWPWVGAVIALAAVGPSLAWQAAHDFPVVEFVRNQGTGGAILGLRGRPGFLAALVLLPGPVALFLWVPGLRSLLRRPDVRALGVLHLAALAVFLLAAGKGYYAAPGLAVLLAAGAATRGTRPLRGLAIGLTIQLGIALPILVPGVLPTSALREQPDLAQATEISERIGWDDLARAVSEATASLSPDERERAVVLGRNYAQAAAVEFYASRYDLPPAMSGHNSAYLWWPEIPDDHIAVVIGFDRPFLRDLYAEVRRAGTVRNRAGVENFEWGEPIRVARGPKVDPDELRRSLKIFTA